MGFCDDRGIGRSRLGVIVLRDVGHKMRSRNAMASKECASPKSGLAARSFAMLTSGWQEARSYFGNRYRPELHYMRGPGPKWRARNGRAR